MINAFTWIVTVLACFGALRGLVLYARYGVDRQLNIATKAIRMGGAIFLIAFSLLVVTLALTGWKWELAVCMGSICFAVTIGFSILNYLNLEILESKIREANRLLKENPEVEEKLRRMGYDISKLKQDDDEP
jgi:hypothetical protein